MLQLLDQHIREAHAFLLAHLQGDLVVIHIAIHIAVARIKQGIAKAGLAHAFQHHIQIQTLKLLCNGAQVFLWIIARVSFQVGETVKVGKGLCIYSWQHARFIQWTIPQLIMQFACQTL